MAAGGWGPSALKTWQALAQGIAARSGELVGVEADRLFQSLAVTLQRENARAVLRRVPAGAEVGVAALADPQSDLSCSTGLPPLAVPAGAVSPTGQRHGGFSQEGCLCIAAEAL